MVKLDVQVTEATQVVEGGAELSQSAVSGIRGRRGAAVADQEKAGVLGLRVHTRIIEADGPQENIHWPALLLDTHQLRLDVKLIGAEEDLAAIVADVHDVVLGGISRGRHIDFSALDGGASGWIIGGALEPQFVVALFHVEVTHHDTVVVA